jgi:flagellar hook-associated protein 1
VSLVSLLNIARSALMVHQRAMTITGNNVANAQTPGYSRQRLDLIQATPQMSTLGAIGRGVDASGISRSRDVFFDAAYRRESGLLGNASTNATLLSQLEAGIGEPGSDGLGAALDGLFTAFSDLANDPSSVTARTMTRQAGARLVEQFHQTAGRISEIATDSTARMREQVAEVNRLTQQIAGLNTGILAAGPAGNAALSDQRDLAVDQLSSMVSAQVTQRSDGTIAVSTGGALLVDGANARELTVRATPAGTPGVGFTSDSGTIDVGSGSLKALVDLTNTTLPGYQAQLDLLAQNLVSQVNTQHRAGYTPTGDNNLNFFDPTGTSAASIQLSSEVLASIGSIATGDTTASGDGANAQRLGDLIRVPIAGLGNQSLRDFFVNFTSTVGVAVSDAQQQATIQQALVDHADGQRQQVSGVSVDEEMVNLISQQQAYGAAARLVNVANEMVQDLLNMI